MRQVGAITRKELAGYFGSPMALLFVGVFLAVSLFVFFWVDTFFARGIADVRPLFSRMPVLLIFLVAALTMRQWSEEQRSGTLEVLLTLPVTRLQLALGKFLAVMALVALSLALTLFLPITVAILGPLDAGPVVGGYLAALLLAAAYTAIGLFVSSLTDNQIVSLILTVLLCGILYLVGSSGVIDFLGDAAGEVLRAIGTGSRFESIERGVVDLRDLVYYLSLTGIFMTLNVFSLDRKRWSSGARAKSHRQTIVLTTSLVALNLLLLNVWLYPLRGMRLDLTAQREYSLSQVTRDLLGNLQEPLLIRGYFSEKTHPLLAPLVPRIRDTLEEYKAVSGGLVQLEILDPTQDPDVEAEANQIYGIRPMPFQVAGRYETSIINSYFDLLIRYGDQSAVLTYADLLEITWVGENDVEVRLRNLEYDLTSTIKRVVYGFRSVDVLLAALDDPAELTLFATAGSLPEELADAPAVIEKVLQEMAGRSGGQFTYSIVDPDVPGSPITRQDLRDRYGLQPLAVSFFSQESYYLHMILRVGDKGQLIYPSADLSEAGVRNAIESALKRVSAGFLQVVGLWTPPATTQDIYGQPQQSLSGWQEVSDALRQEYEVRTVDLSTGQVPADVDVLVLVAPQGMGEKERFAVDQYLMRGGAVIVAAGNYQITIDPLSGGLGLQYLRDSLADLLASYGIHVEQALVMDPQSEPFPVQVVRDVGGIQVREIQAVDYPFFVDVRADGMAAGNPIVSNLQALTLQWASPIVVDAEKNAGRQVTTLLQSSTRSWTQADIGIQPDFVLYPDLGFPVGVNQQRYALAVALQGVFESAFKGQAAPEGPVDWASPLDTTPEGGEGPLPPAIEVSPETARLVVVGSAEFLDDTVFNLSSSLSGDRYLNNLRFVQNAVAWATEDLDLLSIRARGTYARVLRPMEQGERSLWEAANYTFALVALAAIGVVWNLWRRQEQPMSLLSPSDSLISREEVER